MTVHSTLTAAPLDIIICSSRYESHYPTCHTSEIYIRTRQLEMLVQYRAACFVWGDHGEDNIVSDMLKQLDWPTLEE